MELHQQHLTAASMESKQKERLNVSDVDSLLTSAHQAVRSLPLSSLPRSLSKHSLKHDKITKTSSSFRVNASHPPFRFTCGLFFFVLCCVFFSVNSFINPPIMLMSLFRTGNHHPMLNHLQKQKKQLSVVPFAATSASQISLHFTQRTHTGSAHCLIAS